MKINQKGFSVIEILVVILVVGLLGVAGWLVYDNQKSPKQDTTTQKTSNTQTETKTTESPKATEQTQQAYLEIKEWGVKLPISSGTKGLNYTIKANVAILRSADLDNLTGTDCTRNSVHVARGKATETVPNDTSDSGSTFLDVYNNIPVDNSDPTIVSIKAKAGDYYYVAPGYPAASCVDIPYIQPEGKAKQEAEAQARREIVKAINQLVQL